MSPPVLSGPQLLSFQVFPLQSLRKSLSYPTPSKGEEQKGLSKPKMGSDPAPCVSSGPDKSFNTDA